MKRDSLFINWHHRELFRYSHGPAYSYAVDGIGDARGLEAIRRTYPHLYRRLKFVVECRKNKIALPFAS